MADDQEALKAEYRRLAKERGVFQRIVNEQMALWNGQGQKPDALTDAETSRDALDIELARVADKMRF